MHVSTISHHDGALGFTASCMASWKSCLPGSSPNGIASNITTTTTTTTTTKWAYMGLCGPKWPWDFCCLTVVFSMVCESLQKVNSRCVATFQVSLNWWKWCVCVPQVSLASLTWNLELLFSVQVWKNPTTCSTRSRAFPSHTMVGACTKRRAGVIAMLHLHSGPFC